ncbi:hypothetical protein C8R44DRAFT_978817 [Mycena epipterygia]|nr:hypothetical protein C8R44DRAFT_978817 [Mycena epipterygia]
MSSSTSGYFAHLVQVCWSFVLSLFCSRHRKHPAALPELPTSSPVPPTGSQFNPPSFQFDPERIRRRDEPYAFDGLESWQKDKQQFLRRPSLVKANSTSIREPRKKRDRTVVPPPPEIYVQDWSSLGLNMADLFDSPSPAVPRSGMAEESSVPTPPYAPGAELEMIPEDSSFSSSDSEDPANNDPSSPELSASQSNDVKTALEIDLAASLTDTNTETDSSTDLNEESQGAGIQVPKESATLSFSTGGYASNALSAVSELLWDPPTASISHSTPLPTPIPSKRRPQSTNARDSVVPYPDLFDFAMYTRRISRDSFGEAFELPSVAFSVDEPSDKKSGRPISIYDVAHDRDRYRSAAYSACLPIRAIFGRHGF